MNRVTERAITLHEEGWSTRRIARELGVSQVAVWKYLKKHERMRGRTYGTGACEICQKTNVPLDADHDHKTGEARGMLCRSCNQGLGHFKDDIVTLREAAKYLRIYTRQPFVEVLYEQTGRDIDTDPDFA